MFFDAVDTASRVVDAGPHVGGYGEEVGTALTLADYLKVYRGEREGERRGPRQGAGMPTVFRLPQGTEGGGDEVRGGCRFGGGVVGNK